MTLDLVPLWAGIIAFGVFMYVLLDGFDLGVGILAPFAPGDAGRDSMMDSVAPRSRCFEVVRTARGTAHLGRAGSSADKPVTTERTWVPRSDGCQRKPRGRRPPQRAGDIRCRILGR